MSTSNPGLVPFLVMLPLYVTPAVLPLATKPVPVGFVIEVLLENENVPPEPFKISIPASPPFSVFVPLKL